MPGGNKKITYLNKPAAESKINNENTRIVCEICSKLMIKKQEKITDVALVTLLLTLKMQSSKFKITINDNKE